MVNTGIINQNSSFTIYLKASALFSNNFFK